MKSTKPAYYRFPLFGFVLVATIAIALLMIGSQTPIKVANAQTPPLPENLAISSTGVVTWDGKDVYVGRYEHDIRYTKESGFAKYFTYIIGFATCSQEDKCRWQIPDFDGTKQYEVGVRTRASGSFSSLSDWVTVRNTPGMVPVPTPTPKLVDDGTEAKTGDVNLQQPTPTPTSTPTPANAPVRVSDIRPASTPTPTSTNTPTPTPTSTPTPANAPAPVTQPTDTPTPTSTPTPANAPAPVTQPTDTPTPTSTPTPANGPTSASGGTTEGDHTPTPTHAPISQPPIPRHTATPVIIERVDVTPVADAYIIQPDESITLTAGNVVVIFPALALSRSYQVSLTESSGCQDIALGCAELRVYTAEGELIRDARLIMPAEIIVTIGPDQIVELGGIGVVFQAYVMGGIALLAKDDVGGGWTPILSRLDSGDGGSFLVNAQTRRFNPLPFGVSADPNILELARAAPGTPKATPPPAPIPTATSTQTPVPAVAAPPTPPSTGDASLPFALLLAIAATVMGLALLSTRVIAAHARRNS